MDSCPYYHEVRISGSKSGSIPCCRHKHTPASCEQASLRTEKPYVLSCAGRLSKCQIPPYLQLDIE